MFVSDESGGVEAVFDAAGRRIATVQLGGEAGNVQYDAVSGKVLADVQTRNEVAVIDPRSNRVVRRIAVPGCDSPHGLLIDAPRRLAFVACDGNARLLTLDLKTMKFTGNFGVGDTPDVLAFDTGSKRLYVSAESGVVAVAVERGRKLVKLGQAFLASNAHTVAVDPATHLVYFPLESGEAASPSCESWRRKGERDVDGAAGSGTQQADGFDDEPDHGLLDPNIRRAWADLILPQLPPAPASVLDVGCGTGSSLPSFSRRPAATFTASTSRSG